MPHKPLTRAELDALRAYVAPIARRLVRLRDRLHARGVQTAGQEHLWEAAKAACDALWRLDLRATTVTAADEPARGPAKGDPVPPQDGAGGQHAPPPAAVADAGITDAAAYERIRAAAARAMRRRRRR